jgi:hypothetical protein
MEIWPSTNEPQREESAASAPRSSKTSPLANGLTLPSPAAIPAAECLIVSAQFKTQVAALFPSHPTEHPSNERAAGPQPPRDSPRVTKGRTVHRHENTPTPSPLRKSGTGQRRGRTLDSDGQHASPRQWQYQPSPLFQDRPPHRREEGCGPGCQWLAGVAKQTAGNYPHLELRHSRICARKANRSLEITASRRGSSDDATECQAAVYAHAGTEIVLRLGMEHKKSGDTLHHVPKGLTPPIKSLGQGYLRRRFRRCVCVNSSQLW